MRSTFRDLALQAQLERDGYLVVELLDDHQLYEARGFLDALDLPADTPFLATSNETARHTATWIQHEVSSLLEPSLERVLPDHETFIAGFIVKGAHPSGPVEPHQDLTYTDERRYRTIIVWAPLSDVDPEHGTLHVVPGSHRWTTGIRPSGTRLAPTEEHRDDLWRLAVPLSLMPGQAVLYDAALVHASTANESEVPRPVLAAALAPRGAEFMHFHDVGGELRGHLVDRRYFEDQRLLDEPVGYATLDPWTTAVTARDFPCRGATAPGGHALGRDRDGEFATDQAMPTTPDLGRRSPHGRRRRPLITTRFALGLEAPSPRQALLDPALDQRLRRDGFVRFPLLDEGAASRLRDQYGELHGWHGTGFEADITNADMDYRHRVSRHLATELDDVVCSRFAGYVPYLRVFLCKWPGEDSGLYLHRDWMYVDEREGHRTYVVWIALQDVDGPEGQIQVLRHSHRLDPMLRGTNLNAAWIEREPLVRSHLLAVPVRAGEALVMDNALVHCSMPNHSTRPRVVAAVGVRPAESSLVHFSRHDEHHAHRYEIDEEFFLSTTPQDLLSSPPDLPVAEVAPIGERDLRPTELAARLYSSPLTDLDSGRRLADRIRRRVGDRRTG